MAFGRPRKKAEPFLDFREGDRKVGWGFLELDWSNGKLGHQKDGR